MLRTIISKNGNLVNNAALLFIASFRLEPARLCKKAFRCKKIRVMKRLIAEVRNDSGRV